MDRHPIMSQMLPADSVKAMGPDDVTKSAIRNVIWRYIEENDLADFPRPVTRRIPNVKGASTAAELIPQMTEFKKAQVVKINPDKPQEQARFLTIDAGKTLLVPTPRLRNGLFNRINPPSDATKDILRICSTSQGIREYSTTLALDEKVKIDLVITGSVAVSKKGVRIGKGEGFADLDWAMMAAVGAVTPDTVVITTVNECQIVDIPDQLMADHDLPVDYIVTPLEIIKCNRTQNKPAGIIWSKVEPSKLRRTPILRKIWVMEKENGKDVTLKDGQEFDLEAAEKDDQEREQRRKERMEQEGEEEGGRRRFRRFRRRFGGRFASSGRGRGQGRPQSRDRTESEGAEGTDGERQERGGGEGSQDRRDHTRPRRYRRRPNPRRSKSPQGEGDGSGDTRDRGEPREPRDRREPREPRDRREPREPRDRREPREPRDRREPREPRDRREPREPRDRREPREPRDRREPREPRDRERNEFDGEGNDNRRPQRRRPRPRWGRQPSLFVGGLPRSLRVSTFKTEVRGRDVDPLRVIWHGGNGHAFLQFENADMMEFALTALGDLNINGKKLRVEEAKGHRPQERTSQNDDSRERAPADSSNVE